MKVGGRYIAGWRWVVLAGFWFAFNGPLALAQPAIPALSARVVDQADILSSSTERQLVAMLEAHEELTSNQVAVLTVASLEGGTIEDYALQVARAWQLGRGDVNNGVLLLVAVGDRKMRIEVGYGLEGDIPDIIAKRIIDQEIKPSFRRGDFDEGVSNGVRAILGAIEGTYTPKESSNDIDDAPLLFRLIFSTMFMGIPLIFAFISLISDGCIRWFLFLFITPFIGIGGFVLWPPYGALVSLGLYFAGYFYAAHHIKNSPKWQKIKEKMKEASKKGETVDVKIGGMSFKVGGSSGGGGWSSGGGGGFSGGGGSFGGGGASGSW